MPLVGKRVVVVGLGKSGVAAARLCLRLGARVVANDAKPLDALPQEARGLEEAGAEIVAGTHSIARMDAADLVVVSPGVPRLSELLAAEARGVPIWGELELAARFLVHPAPIVAIGGTNGKSTTTSLVGEFLVAHGLKVFVGGNLGQPLADHVETRFDAVVLEVSSFQMERVDRFRPQVSALLNVTEDHMDRYADFGEYARAKGNAFVRQSPEDWAVVPHADSICMRQARRGLARIVTFGPGGTLDVQPDAVVDRDSGETFQRGAMALAGGHNALNVAAAIACLRPFGVRPDTVREVLGSFRGLPHRTTLVAQMHGVRFYDDSKGTNVGAAVTALEGLVESHVVLIAGGRHKGGSYAALVHALERKGRAVVLLGEAADVIERAVDHRLPVVRAQSMDEAVRVAAKLARPGDAVLLSPACSSFDMFRDYKHRGEEFVRAVHAFARVGSCA